ncbi:MAG TPA: FG-GAP repeat protein [Rudaea sp.]|jgi:hypothetical protein|nr:FG-GAP repeat protein [Rudaea sp.]
MSSQGATLTYLSDITLPMSGDIPQFGLSVAISGNEALVAAPKQSDKASGFATAYFKDASGTWQMSVGTTLSYAHSAIDASSYLPCNGVAIDGDAAVLGVPEAAGGHGIVEVFQLDSSGWGQTDVLSAQMPSAFETFGCATAISGDTMVVSAPGHAGVGAAYVFVRQAAGWELQSQLTATSAAANDAVGLSASIDGDVVVLGAPHSNANKGAAYVFRRSGTTWSEVKKLIAAGGSADDQFGATVAVSNGTIVVGAPDFNAGQGAVYIYSGTAFTPQSSPLTETAQRFGSAVAVSGNRVIVGAIGSNAAYAYTREGTEWFRRQTFGDLSTSRFGGAVGISGSDAIIGAMGVDHAYIVHDDQIFANGYQ